MLKYKNYNKHILLIKEFPKRLEKLKHLKWKKFYVLLKNKNKRDLKLKKGLISVLIIKKSLYFWEKKKNNFLFAKLFNIFYNGGIKISTLKKNMEKSNSFLIKKYLLKPIYKINILFWILNWCKSTREFKYFMFYHKITINNKILKNINFLKKGDIISFNILFNKFTNLQLKSITSKIILSFIEIDIYNNSFIIIKDLSELNINDFYLSINTYYNTLDIKSKK